MRAGRLRHRITIQKSTPVQDTYGEPIDSWATFATVWASVEPLTGKELFTAQQDVAIGAVLIRIRHRTGITEKMRVSYESKIFDIRHVAEVKERNREIHLMCQEVNQNV